MIKIIGNENCSRCEMAKRILNEKGIEFEYTLFSELENRTELRKEAMSKGMMSFPIIFKNDEMVGLEEVLA